MPSVPEIVKQALPQQLALRRVKLKHSVAFAGSEYLALLPEMRKPNCSLAWWQSGGTTIGVVAREPISGETVYIPLGNIIGVLEARPAEAKPAPQ